ncbi:MAG TPA: ABC transporter ATP-binding protein [Gaiellaceae bacterium]|nr:ABC transporter ATP-binding protein [Gaiellaceae bacterium]
MQRPRARKRTGLTRLGRYLAGQGGRVALLAIVGVCSAAAPVAALLVVQDAIDKGMQGHDESRLTRDVVIYLAINALAWVLQTTLVRGLAGVGQSVVLGLRRDLFDHLTTLSLRYFSQQKAGWIIARLTSDVDALSDVLSQGLTTLVVNTLTLLAAIVGLFILDWRLGLVALVILPPTLVLTRWFQVRSHAAFLQVRETISSMTAQIAESVSGMAVIQAFNREQAFRAEFDSANDANRRTNTHAQYLNSLFFPGIEMLGAIAMVSVLWVGGRMITDNTLSIGTLVSAVFLLNLVFQPLQELSDLYGQVQSAGAAMEKITTVLDVEAEIRDEPGSAVAPRIEGDLQLDQVTFAYGKEPVLHAIDIHVAPGGCLALVGESGGGKSTTAKLVGRFYDPDSGAIRVDGRDLRELELRSYRRQLGVVLQDPFLFAGTIADNIRFARPEATDEEVADVATSVGIDRIARRFDEGLLHEVREGGSGLSAGERQLISIARALLADPRILILDEATSNIDRPTEILIERALDRLLRGRTSIIIAHRLATVRRADQILVMEHGRISQRGRFDELLASEGPFRRLASQLQGSGDLQAAPVTGSRPSSSASVASSERE